MTPRPDAEQAYRLSRRLAALYAACVLALLAAMRIPNLAAVEAWRTGLAGALVGSLTLATTGLFAVTIVQRARMRAGRPGRAARRPQAIIVPVGALLAAAAAWLLRPVPGLEPVAAPQTLYALGGAAIVLAFPLLVAERSIAAQSPEALPEARALSALLLLPAVLWPLAGIIAIAAGLRAPATTTAGTLLALFIIFVAAELAIRASANWFLPPPEPEGARAAIDSLAVRLARPAAIARGGINAPIRNHFGIDFSRSWALAYMRDAALPVGALLLLFCWGLTGAGLIDMDQRGIYERFGAPVRVLGPGLHVVLPWPLGRIRRVEYGMIHAEPIGDAPATDPAPVAAEDPPPPSADRLWEQSHPSELAYLIASRDSGGRETFQSVSADLRVVWRVGLSDTAALQAAYAVGDPSALVRARAGRLVGAFFAVRTLDAVLGEGREQVAAGLRDRLQADLAGTGIEILSIVIEAIHPPSGAAEAYHNVQAAEIMSRENVASERGRAVTTAKLAATEARKLTDSAQAGAADIVGKAETNLSRFTADAQAAQAGGRAFLLERYFASLAGALQKSPLVILDHNLPQNGATLDLRGLAGAAQASAADED